MVLSVEECYELSLLSHEWNIPGLSLFCCLAGIHNMKGLWWGLSGISTMPVLSAGLASLCDASLVRLESQGNLLLGTPTNHSIWSFTKPGSPKDMDVLDWASLAACCNLTKFCSVCEHYICRNLNAVRMQ